MKKPQKVKLTPRIAAAEPEPEIVRHFVETSIHQTFTAALTISRKLKGASLVYGPAGCGKSTSCYYTALQDEKAVFVRFDETKITLNHLYRAILDAAKWRYYRTTGYDLSLSARAALQDMSEEGKYLILDEWQGYNHRAILQLLRFTEEINGFVVPMLLVGIRARLHQTHSSADLYDQIYSRMLTIRRIEAPIREDFEKIGSAHGVEGLDAFKEVVSIGLAHSIRDLVTVLRAARTRKGRTGGLSLGDIEWARLLLDEPGTSRPAA